MKLLRVLSLALAVTASAVAQPTASIKSDAQDQSDRLDHSESQINRLAREAHTVQQYTVLADYYATQRRAFAHKASEAMHIWADRNTAINALSEKWPRPVDAARNLHDYYAWKATYAEAMRAKYDRLADAADSQ